MTTFCTAGAAIVAFLAADLSAYSLHELQQGLRLIVTVAGSVAALACLLGNVGKFRDVFSDRATARVQRFEAIKEEVQSQVEAIESLLISHRLITQADVERRRAEADGRAAMTSESSAP